MPVIWSPGSVCPVAKNSYYFAARVGGRNSNSGYKCLCTTQSGATATVLREGLEYLIFLQFTSALKPLCGILMGFPTWFSLF